MYVCMYMYVSNWILALLHNSTPQGEMLPFRLLLLSSVGKGGTFVNGILRGEGVSVVLLVWSLCCVSVWNERNWGSFVFLFVVCVVST